MIGIATFIPIILAVLFQVQGILKSLKAEKLATKDIVDWVFNIILIMVFGRVTQWYEPVPYVLWLLVILATTTYTFLFWNKYFLNFSKQQSFSISQ